MDQQNAQVATTPSRVSGIPRLSRLPIPRSTPSKPISGTALERPRIGPGPSRPALQKRSSVASLRSAGSAGGLRNDGPTAASNGTHVPTTSGAKTLPRPQASDRTGTVRPSSRGTLQRTASRPPLSSQHEDEDPTDLLSSLSGFRAASRHGSHDEKVPSPQEYVATPEDEVHPPLAPSERKRSSRPSLSDRTIESLQSMPSTPKDRRRSSFFSPIESPMAAMGPPPLPPLSRPSSSLSRHGSGHDRPGTSDGLPSSRRPASPMKKLLPGSAKPASRTVSAGFVSAAGGMSGTLRSTGLGRQPKGLAPAPSAKPPVSAKKETVPPASIGFTPKRVVLESKASNSRPPSRETDSMAGLTNGLTPRRLGTGSKTLAARPSKARPALGDAFKSPSKSTLPDSKGLALGAKRVVSNPSAETSTSSSAALRQQIAAAKAAARKDKSKQDSPLQAHDVSDTASYDMAGSSDPFNAGPKDEKHILRNRIRSAWSDGKLNIAAMELKSVPAEVMSMYDAKAMEDGKINWAEVVDLTKLIAADNDIEELGEDVFPDRALDAGNDDDDAPGNQFGGLEVLDLHSNILRSVPLGLRRLERLTTLNLAHNKLQISCLESIAQVSSLRELRLGHNALSGNLPTSICQLANLETLDLQGNRLLGLPEGLRELIALRVLNVAGNQLTSIPMDALAELPLLQELDASSNALIGSLFPLGSKGAHPTLKILNVGNNSLAALTFDTVNLPKLQNLDVTNNHLTALPPMQHGWDELRTLRAGENKIAELPDGFTGLGSLRTVDFTSNELRMLDPAIARMDGLQTFILSSNPLRERKWLTMSAADIKRDLRAKLEPEDQVVDGAEDDLDGTGIQDQTAHVNGTKTWTLKPNGLLDLSSQGLDDTVDDALADFLRANDVKDIHLHHNKLTAIPPALRFAPNLRSLDLSHNAFASDYLWTYLELPLLQELHIGHCGLTDLAPLLADLVAPELKTLVLTANRLAGALPVLRNTYPELTMLVADDNAFSAISVEALQGLHTVNVAGNAIDKLPAEIGLLWDEGLRHLDVSRNAFGVPGYRVLEKGTEDLCRWLKERLPLQREDES